MLMEGAAVIGRGRDGGGGIAVRVAAATVGAGKRAEEPDGVGAANLAAADVEAPAAPPLLTTERVSSRESAIAACKLIN